jgi:tRNA threonylcarbamoyladenosine biosynthesis protein TsaE
MHIHPCDDKPATVALPDEAATLALGAALAATLTHSDLKLVVTLEGDLGAGKTTLVRGLLRALGHSGPVKSPTYNLVELYVVSGLNLYHFDFYRFNQAEEYLDAGLDEYFSGNGIRLVEWPDKAAPYLPPADLCIHLGFAAADGRIVHIEAGSEEGGQCLTNLLSRFPAVTFSNSPPPA